MNKRELRATRNEQKNSNQANIKTRKDKEKAEEKKTVADRHLPFETQ